MAAIRVRVAPSFAVRLIIFWKITNVCQQAHMRVRNFRIQKIPIGLPIRWSTEKKTSVESTDELNLLENQEEAVF